MRSLWRFLRRPLVLQVLGLALLAGAIYAMCPLLRLEGEQRRSVVLLFIGVAVVCLAILRVRALVIERRFTRSNQVQAREQAARLGQDAQQDLARLEQSFQQAFDELAGLRSEDGFFRSGGSRHLPWIIIMGPPGAGKSTAVQTSGLRFTHLGRRVQGIGGTRNCTWWLTQESVFLDTAGRYAVQEEDHAEWLGFLKLLRKYRRARPIDAVLLQIGIDELHHLSDAEIEATALQLQQRLDELTRHLQVRFPVHLVIGKLDRLEGFTEVFGGLSRDERAPAWGLSLDAHTPDGEPIGARFQQRFEALIAAVGERVSIRMAELGGRSEREAALTLTAELARHGERLQRFIEFLFEADRRIERSWLASVYFISATQEGSRLAGERQRTAKSLGISGSTAEPAIHPSGPYFVRGLFERVIEQAGDAARPSARAIRQMRARQVGAVGALVPLCACSSWYLGVGYREDTRWLERVTRASEGLSAPPIPIRTLTSLSTEAMGSELDREAQLEQLLSEREPSGLVREVHELAADALRRRIDAIWLQPIVPAIEADLRRGGEWTREGAGADFAAGYAALKADFVLRRQECAGADVEATIAWASQHLAGIWARRAGGVLEAEPPTTAVEALEARLRFFFSGNTASEASADARLRDRARTALQGQVPAELIFHLVVADSALSGFETQLEGELFADHGLQTAYTMDGCEQFVGTNGRGREWWRCLLDIAEPPTLSGDRDRVYLARYREARYGWLRGIELKKPISDVSVAAEAFANLSRAQGSELDRLLELLGSRSQVRNDRHAKATQAVSKAPGPFGFLRGCARQTGGMLETAEDYASTSAICRQAREMFAPFPGLLGEEGAAAEAYRTYRDRARALHGRLKQVSDSSRINEEALLLVRDTMLAQKELYDVSGARRELTARLKLAAPGVDPTAIDSLLEQIEQATVKALVPLAASGLQHRWRPLYAEWQEISSRRALSAQNQSASCERIKQFLLEDVKRFVEQELAAFFQGGDLSGCQQNEIAGGRMPLQDGTCATLDDALKTAFSLECPTETAESANVAVDAASPTFDPLEVEPVGTGCEATLEGVIVDTGDKMLECRMARGRCEPMKARDSSGKARLIAWQRGQKPFMVYEAPDLHGLLRYGHRDGRLLTFALPDLPCAGIGVAFTMPARGVGPLKPRQDTRWKQITLPPDL